MNLQALSKPALICLLLLAGASGSSFAQGTVQTNGGQNEPTKTAEPVPASDARAFAISVIVSLATEARSFADLALRARVMARAADALWEFDNDTARSVFARAWDAAEKADLDDAAFKTKDNPPPMVVALRRTRGHDLRSEVLTLAAGRDQALGEQLLAKLKNQNDLDSKSGAANPRDQWSSSEDETKRLLLARRLLDNGQIQRALEFAIPCLDHVNANSIGFLSALRVKDSAAADQRFALLLARVELDPSSDANTVSGLSSYAFTPGFYVTFSSDGGARWASGEVMDSPHLASQLRDKFFQVATNILLRPLPRPDQDETSAGRIGKAMVIKRLLPLFDQYAPNIATALRSQLSTLARQQRNAVDDESTLLTSGLHSETGADILKQMQDLLDHARFTKQRDEIYADTAVALANQSDARAQGIADEIDDTARRAQVRQYVDLQLIEAAIGKKAALDVTRLASTGQLTHTQRAWAYTQAARLLKDRDQPLALQILQQAFDEARRIDDNPRERAVVLIGEAIQLFEVDPDRAWTVMAEAIKSANAAEDFTGEVTTLTVRVSSKRGLNAVALSGEFDLASALRKLTKNDLDRSIDLARSFKNDAPRSVALLAVARAVLEK